MRKIYYFLIALLSLGNWACQDDVIETIKAPVPSFDEFVDQRDGKLYHTVTIGEQTWMVENFAYRLPDGHWAGCYTFNELIAKFLDTAEIYAAIPKPKPEPSDPGEQEPIEVSFDDFLAEVAAAEEDGRISSDMDIYGVWTPKVIVDMVIMYVDYDMLDRTIDAFIYDTEWGVASFEASEPKSAADCIAALEAIVSKLQGGGDPYELFMEEIEAAKADGRISADMDIYGPWTPTVLVDMVIMYVDMGMIEPTIDDFMNHDYGIYAMAEWYPEAAAGLIPVLEEIIAEINGEEAPWAPSDEDKAAALAAAVKEVQDAAFANAELSNGNYSEKFGLLYTLDAARLAVPEGWRIPTDEDWKTLERTLGMPAGEIDLMQEWRGAQTGGLLKDEETGFGLLYGGTRAYNNINGYASGTPYIYKEVNAYFLTNTQVQLNDSTYVAVVRMLSALEDGILRGTSHLTAAHSLRLIKDDGKKNDDDLVIDGGNLPGEGEQEEEVVPEGED